MEDAKTLDEQIYRFGFWSVLIVIASGSASGFIPLDVPGGYAAADADRVLWLQANRTLFIAAGSIKSSPCSACPRYLPAVFG